MNKSSLWYGLYFVLFVVYIIALIYITVLSNQYLRLQEDHTLYFKLIPSIIGIITANETLGFKLKNLLGNIILFLPYGFLLPIVLRMQIKFVYIYLVSLLGVLLSTIIELVQVFFAFRIFDIDDIILNTIGTTFGFTLLLLLSRQRYWPLSNGSVNHSLKGRYGEDDVST